MAFAPSRRPSARSGSGSGRSTCSGGIGCSSAGAVATIPTHAVIGASLAPLAPQGVSRSRLACALAVGAVFPDLDVLSFALGIPYEHPLGHRGFSHSLVFAAALAGVVARFGFPAVDRGPRARWRLFALLFAATASHGILDALTNGGLGVGLLLPFST